MALMVSASGYHINLSQLYVDRFQTVFISKLSENKNLNENLPI